MRAIDFKLALALILLVILISVPAIAEMAGEKINLNEYLEFSKAGSQSFTIFLPKDLRVSDFGFLVNATPVDYVDYPIAGSIGAPPHTQNYQTCNDYYWLSTQQKIDRGDGLCLFSDQTVNIDTDLSKVTSAKIISDGHITNDKLACMNIGNYRDYSFWESCRQRSNSYANFFVNKQCTTTQNTECTGGWKNVWVTTNPWYHCLFVAWDICGHYENACQGWSTWTTYSCTYGTRDSMTFSYYGSHQEVSIDKSALKSGQNLFSFSRPLEIPTSVDLENPTLRLFTDDVYPKNLKLDFGADGSYEYSSSGEARGRVEIKISAEAVNLFLEKCNADADGDCQVQVNVYSDSAGGLDIQSMSVASETEESSAAVNPFALAGGGSQNSESNAKENNSSAGNILLPLALLSGAGALGYSYLSRRNLGAQNNYLNVGADIENKTEQQSAVVRNAGVEKKVLGKFETDFSQLGAVSKIGTGFKISAGYLWDDAKNFASAAGSFLKDVYTSVKQDPVGSLKNAGVAVASGVVKAGEGLLWVASNPVETFEKIGGAIVSGAKSYWNALKSDPVGTLTKTAMVVAGIGLMFTGIGAPAGTALIGTALAGVGILASQNAYEYSKAKTEDELKARAKENEGDLVWMAGSALDVAASAVAVGRVGAAAKGIGKTENVKSFGAARLADNSVKAGKSAKTAEISQKTLSAVKNAYGSEGEKALDIMKRLGYSEEDIKVLGRLAESKNIKNSQKVINDIVSGAKNENNINGAISEANAALQEAGPNREVYMNVFVKNDGTVNVLSKGANINEGGQQVDLFIIENGKTAVAKNGNLVVKSGKVEMQEVKTTVSINSDGIPYKTKPMKQEIGNGAKIELESDHLGTQINNYQQVGKAFETKNGVETKTTASYANAVKDGADSTKTGLKVNSAKSPENKMSTSLASRLQQKISEFKSGIQKTEESGSGFFNNVKNFISGKSPSSAPTTYYNRDRSDLSNPVVSRGSNSGSPKSSSSSGSGVSKPSGSSSSSSGGFMNSAKSFVSNAVSSAKATVSGGISSAKSFVSNIFGKK